MKRCLLLLLCALWMLPFVTAAQSSGVPYTWEAGGLTLEYPEGWDEPAPTEENGQQILRIAQIQSASPESRPPGVPIITLTLETLGGGGDLNLALQNSLTTLDIQASSSNPSTLAGGDAVEATGTNADGQLFGIGRATALADGSLLTIMGRSAAAQQDAFIEIFNAVADSISLGDVPQTAEIAYGVLWNTTRTGADGENAFLSLAGAAYADGKIYSADATVGVVVLDAESGAVTATFANENLISPADIAVGIDGTVYVTDVGCQCVLSLGIDGTWGESISGFGLGAPISLAVMGDKLYATDQKDEGLALRVIKGDDDNSIPLPAEMVAQPILTVDTAGKLWGLTPDGNLWGMETGSDTFTLASTIDLSSTIVNDFAVDQDGNLVLATQGQGVLILTPTGEFVAQVGRIVANYPLAGELVSPRGIATANGTLYVVDSDDSFGAVTAFSTTVTAGRVGSTILLPGVIVQGTLDENTVQQDWTFNGGEGQHVVIAAVDASGTGAFDVALRLIAPDGGEVATNDDNVNGDLPTPYDAEIDVVLATSGTYTVRVERVEGDGSYRLGVSLDQPFELNAEGATELSGVLADAIPVQRWVFQGKAGQVLTITMQAQSGTLDSLLRVLDSDNTVLDENDDAADSALGQNAQIVGVRLPRDGTYFLDARRFQGEGTYSIVIVITS